MFDRTGGLLSEFLAYTPTFTGGIYVAAGNLDGIGKDEIITGTLVDGGPHVKVFDGATSAVVDSFMAYDSSSRGGHRRERGSEWGRPRRDYHWQWPRRTTTVPNLGHAGSEYMSRVLCL